MSEIKELTRKIKKFVQERNWRQFHNPKDLALSLTLEAAEVLEHFQWKSAAEMKKYARTHKEEIGEELADVLYWVLLMSHYLKLDIMKAAEKKLLKNKQKYPIRKARGRHTKYTRL